MREWAELVSRFKSILITQTHRRTIEPKQGVTVCVCLSVNVYLVLCRTQCQCDLCQLGADLRGNGGMEVFVFHLLAICNLLQSLPLRLNTTVSRLRRRNHSKFL